MLENGVGGWFKVKFCIKFWVKFWVKFSSKCVKCAECFAEKGNVEIHIYFIIFYLECKLIIEFIIN